MISTYSPHRAVEKSGGDLVTNFGSRKYNQDGSCGISYFVPSCDNLSSGLMVPHLITQTIILVQFYDTPLFHQASSFHFPVLVLVYEQRTSGYSSSFLFSYYFFDHTGWSTDSVGSGSW